MGAKSRTKGAAAEREVATLLGHARNARNGLEDGDLKVPADCRFAFEVKRRARGFPLAYEALDQAVGYESERVPVAVIRDDRKDWLVVLRLADAVKVIPGLCAVVEAPCSSD